LKRLSTRDDVASVSVVTMDARVLYDSDRRLQPWIQHLTSLCHYARYTMHLLDRFDELQAVRLRTKAYEILITVHNEQLLIVMQILPDQRRQTIDTNRNTIHEDWETFLKRIETKRE
jgi:hypothetical protein